VIKVNKFIFFREQKSTHISPPDDRCLCYEQLFGLSSGRGAEQWKKPSDTTSLGGMGGKSLSLVRRLLCSGLKYEHISQATGGLTSCPA